METSNYIPLVRQNKLAEGHPVKAYSANHGKPALQAHGTFLRSNHLAVILDVDGTPTPFPRWEWRFWVAPA